MKKYPKVSVVTITYGHENYIIETIKGVLMQEYQGDIEFIIANDNSPDETDKVVKEFFLQNSVPSNFEMKYTNHPNNKGMMPNFIWALQQATGKYIALCEGDDYWIDANKLQKQVDFLEINEVYVSCQHDRQLLYADQSTHLERATKGVFTQCLVFKNILDDKFYKYSETVFNGDTFLQFYLALYGNFKHLNFVGAVYRTDGNGVYSSLNKLQQDSHNVQTFKSFLQLEKYFKEDKHKQIFKCVSTLLLEKQFITAVNNKNQKLFFNNYLISFFKNKGYHDILEYKRIVSYFMKK